MRRVSDIAGRAGTGLLGGVAAALCAVAPAGAADLKVVGVWTAYQSNTSDGLPICGIYSGFPDGRSFYLKWFKGFDHLVVQAFKDTWQIPPHVTPKVSVTFADGSPWTATSTSSDTQTNKVEINIPKAVVKPFIKDFTTSSAGTLEFPGGSEPSWVLDMSGSAGALDVMAQCMDGVAGTGADTPLAYLRRPKPAFGATPPPPVVQPPPPRPSQPF